MNSQQSMDRRPAGTGTVILCFLVALFEGLDIQAAGVVGPLIAKEYGLGPGELGWLFGIGTLGLMPGAAIGGWLADRVGRKRVLIGSIALFGLGCVATTHAGSLTGLLAMRFLTALGLGGAMPNLIALCAEAVDPRRSDSAIAVMYAGIPAGAALAASIFLLSGADDWRWVFYAGGYGPLMVIPLIAALLRESGTFGGRGGAQAGRPAGVGATLWHDGRAGVTASLWLSFLCTLMVFYFLMNWLPSLALKSGLSRAQSGQIQMLFNLAATAGALLIGLCLSRAGRRMTVVGVYCGCVIALFALQRAASFEGMALGGLLAGLFLVGGQSLLYSLAGTAYPTEMRGTGVGAAIAAGRMGAILGPFIAGQLLSLGLTGSDLMRASLPVIAVAAVAAWYLVGSRGAAASTLAGRSA